MRVPVFFKTVLPAFSRAFSEALIPYFLYKSRRLFMSLLYSLHHLFCSNYLLRHQTELRIQIVVYVKYFNEITLVC